MKRLLPVLPRGLLPSPPLLLLGRRCLSTAAGGAGGGDAPAPAAAAAAKPAAGGSGKKKGGKPVGPKMVQPKIKYGHGAQDRPTRAAALAADRAARAAGAAPGAAAAPPQPVHLADPVLAGLLEGAGRGLASPLDLARLVPLVGGVEEPADVDVVAATHRFAGVPRFPDEFKGRVLAVPTREDLDGQTDQEDGGPEAARKEEARAEARRALARARAGDMARELLRGDPALARAQAATAAAAAEDSAAAGGAPPYAYGSEGLLQDELGNLLGPSAAMGLGDARLAGVVTDLARGRRLVPSALDLEMEEAVWDEEGGEGGARITGPAGGDDLRRVPSGILEEFAVPLEFGGNARGGGGRGAGSLPGYGEAPSAREAGMTPEERSLNDKRKALRAIIEAPVPVATRPIWPLYSLIVGSDTVRLVTGGGVVDSIRCMVVVGNGHGGVGVGLAKHKDAFDATRRALEKAQRDMIHLDTRNGCLHHDLLGKKNGVRVLLRANPATGAALKGAPALVDVLELAGVRSASAKIFGSHRRSPYVVMQALFDAFNHHQSPEESAAKRGLRLVRHTVDRVNPRTVYPFSPPGPRFPAANHRFVR